jgi:hypothetical protein
VQPNRNATRLVEPNGGDTSWFFFDRLFFYEPTTPDTMPEVEEQHRRFNELDAPDIEICPQEDLGANDASGEEA